MQSCISILKTVNYLKMIKSMFPTDIFNNSMKALHSSTNLRSDKVVSHLCVHPLCALISILLSPVKHECKPVKGRTSLLIQAPTEV